MRERPVPSLHRRAYLNEQELVTLGHGIVRQALKAAGDPRVDFREVETLIRQAGRVYMEQRRRYGRSALDEIKPNNMRAIIE